MGRPAAPPSLGRPDILMDSQDRSDPLGGLPAADFARPADLASVNLRALAPMQRALLVIDGTVTTFLEAYTLEPMTIVRLAHSRGELPADHAWLGAARGTPIVSREVLIDGRYSRTLYVWALSQIVPERLPPGLGERLELEGEGIGRLLAERTVESRREVLWYGREHVAELPEALRGRAGGEFVSRTYRILHGGRPIALIHERFPLESEGSPARD